MHTNWRAHVQWKHMAKKTNDVRKSQSVKWTNVYLLLELNIFLTINAVLRILRICGGFTRRRGPTLPNFELEKRLMNVLPHNKCDVNRLLYSRIIDFKWPETDMLQTYVGFPVAPLRCYYFGHSKWYILFSEECITREKISIGWNDLHITSL